MLSKQPVCGSHGRVLKGADISTGTLKGVRGLRRGPLYRVSDDYQKKNKSINCIFNIPPGNLCKMYFLFLYKYDSDKIKHCLS